MLIIALACFYPVFINAYYGVKATPKILVWSAQNMGASRAAIFRRVVVPSAAPMIFAAMRVSLALSFIVMFAAEMINARSGLGHMIRVAENSLRFDLMYVSLLAIAILGYAGDRLVRYSHRKPRLARAAGMRFLFIGMALVAWEAAARSGLWSKILFPSLVNIGQELVLFFTRTASLMEVWTSLYRALGGFAFAAAVGIFLGILMGRSKTVAGLLDPLFSGTYAVPKLALFPIFIFVFGIGSLSKVALIFLECLYPIVIMSYAGARSVNRVLLWSAQNMGASRAEILRRVVIPATAPFIFAGFRVAVPVAMIVVVITEMVSSADGLGYLVIYSLSSPHRPDARRGGRHRALGYALDKAVVLARDRLIYWEKLETYYV